MGSYRCSYVVDDELLSSTISHVMSSYGLSLSGMLHCELLLLASPLALLSDPPYGSSLLSLVHRKEWLAGVSFAGLAQRTSRLRTATCTAVSGFCCVSTECVLRTVEGRTMPDAARNDRRLVTVLPSARLSCSKLLAMDATREPGRGTTFGLDKFPVAGTWCRTGCRTSFCDKLARRMGSTAASGLAPSPLMAG